MRAKNARCDSPPEKLLTMRLSNKKAALIVLAVLAIGTSAFAQRKSDTVIMKNGDRFTGEIKGLENGQLSFKSSYMASAVQLDWEQVQSVESQDQFIIAMTQGRHYIGTIKTGEESNSKQPELQIVGSNSTLEIKQQDILTIQQQRRRFLRQLDGSINYGFSFTGDNQQIASSLAANARYNARVDVAEVATSSQFNTQTNSSNSNRFTLSGNYSRRFKHDYFATGLFDLLKSEQQDLNLRTTYGGGLGKDLIRTRKTDLGLMGGLVYTHESYFPQANREPVQDNLESFTGLRFSTFRFGVVDLNSQFSVFPSLTDPGRVRLSTQSNVQLELIKNFFSSFQLYENFDSRPPINAPRNDLGITTSIGWKF
jgi:hypothetical protein